MSLDEIEIAYKLWLKRDKENPAKRYVNMEHLLEALREVKQPVEITILFPKVIANFNLDELHDIAFELTGDEEKVSGAKKKKAFARELLKYSRRHKKTHELIEILRQERPNNF